MRPHKVLSAATSLSRPFFGAFAEGGGDHDTGKFVPAVTVMKEPYLGGFGKLTDGDEGSNLRLDGKVQYDHNAGDKRQNDVVSLEGLRHVLERLENPTHAHHVVPVLGGDRNACPPRAFVRICVS